MPGEISLNSLVEVLALDKPVSFATVYVSPHVRSELEEQDYISVPPPPPPTPLLCTHWVVQEKAWKNLFASNLIIIVFPLGYSFRYWTMEFSMQSTFLLFNSGIAWKLFH